MIIGFGEALIDVLPSGEVVGGAPLNFSIRAAELASELGHPVAMVTRIGGDDRGRRIMELLQSRNVVTDYVQQDSSHPTGFVDVQLDDGEASYQFGDDVAYDHIAWTPEMSAVCRACPLICFGSLAQRCSETRTTLMQMLDSTQHAIKIYDINLRRPLPDWEIVESSLEKTHVLKCNEAELKWLAKQLDMDLAETERIAAAIIERFDLRYVFWTRGEDGCVLQDRQRLTSSPLKIDLAEYASLDEDADTIGAGDATAAALAIGLLQSWEAERIVRAANLCGAYAANSRGATAPLPDRVKTLIFDRAD